ncbi:MAG TPA: hypothetical protein PLO63_14120 [Syntrophales bacterium]|nr:hypothetical protein [Syntrophales bacterium]
MEFSFVPNAFTTTGPGRPVAKFSNKKLPNEKMRQALVVSMLNEEIYGESIKRTA